MVVASLEMSAHFWQFAEDHLLLRHRNDWSHMAAMSNARTGAKECDLLALAQVCAKDQKITSEPKDE